MWPRLGGKVSMGCSEWIQWSRLAARSLMSHSIRAIRLDPSLYTEVRDNMAATIPALGVVVLVALAHPVGYSARWVFEL